MLRKYLRYLRIACRKVKELMRHDLPSESHKTAWKNYERILMYRTNFSLFSRVLFDIMAYMAGGSRVQKSKEYIEEGKMHNVAYVDATFAYFEAAFVTLMFGRVILLLISTKYLNVTKCVAYYQLGMELIFEVGLPIDRGLEGAAYVSNMILNLFVFDYFYWIPNAICANIVQISSIAAKRFLYSQDLTVSSIILESFYRVLWQFGNMFVMHIIM